jgi:exoribonuclease-2
MNVFYEESGSFKVGTIVSRADASLQVDTLHGKRAKIKSSNVFLEFSSTLADFLPAAEKMADEIDLDFLWECSPEDEFEHDVLAADYWGHAPRRWRALPSSCACSAPPCISTKRARAATRKPRKKH